VHAFRKPSLCLTLRSCAVLLMQFTYELARRLQPVSSSNITVNALHPGVVATELSRCTAGGCFIMPYDSLSKWFGIIGHSPQAVRGCCPNDHAVCLALTSVAHYSLHLSQLLECGVVGNSLKAADAAMKASLPGG